MSISVEWSNSSLHHAIAGDAILVAGEFAQGHRAAGVELVGGDADLGAEAEFFAIGEAGGDVVKDTGAIDAVEERFCRGGVGGDDAIRVMRTVVIDVGDGFLHRVDDFHGKDVVEILGAPVFFGGRDEIGDNLTALGAATEFNIFFAKGAGDIGQHGRGDVAVDEQGL